MEERIRICIEVDYAEDEPEGGSINKSNDALLDMMLMVFFFVSPLTQ